MQLVGVGERRYFGADNYAVAIFRKDDGTEFELPVTVNQMATILAESGQVRRGPPARTPVVAPAAQARPQTSSPAAAFDRDFGDDGEEVEGTPTIRLARVEGGNGLLENEGDPL